MRATWLSNHPSDELYFTVTMLKSEARQLQRQVEAGTLLRIFKGVYARKISADELTVLVRRNWQKISGVVVPGGVVSHISAMKGGVLASGEVTLSHPTAFNKNVSLPGLRLRVVRGPGPLPGDLPLGTSGLHYAGRVRMLLENIGRKGSLRASRNDVEHLLISVLTISGEKSLNEIRDQAAALAPALGH